MDIDTPGNGNVIQLGRQRNGGVERVKVKGSSQDCPPGQLKRLLTSIERESEVIHQTDCKILAAIVDEFELQLGPGVQDAEVDWEVEAPEVLERRPGIPGSMDMHAARQVLRSDCK